jgi:hypothetical protein
MVLLKSILSPVSILFSDRVEVCMAEEKKREGRTKKGN